MQSPQITPSLPLGQAPHAVRRPPCRAAASRFHIPVFHATFVPHAVPRPPHTWAASPYGIAVSPYNHTPDAFPHTSQQIPIGWSSPHMVSAIHHTIRKLQRIRPQTRRDQRSGSANPQPIQLSNRYPEPALHLQQIQAPAKFTANHYMTCNWGWRWHLLHVCAHLHGYAHTFTAMLIPARVCAIPGHGL